MIVKKDDKHLYAFLKNAFNVLGNETQSKFLLGDGSALYFSTMYIKGRIEIMRKETVNGKPHETGKHNFDTYFYTLKMLDDKSFELKEIENSMNYRKEDRTLIAVEFKLSTPPICDIDVGCGIVLSKIALHAGYEIPDRYINQLKRLNDCTVYSENHHIICTRNEYFSKEDETVKQTMIFECDTWESEHE